MSRRLRPLKVSLMMSFTVAACRGPSSSEPEQAPAPERASVAGSRARVGLVQPPPARPAPAPEAIAVCDLVQRRSLQRKAECCGGAPLTATFDACVHALDRALDAGRVRVDAEALKRCAGALERELGGCDWVTPSVPLPPAECRALVSGLASAGAACHSSLECAAPLHCAGATPAQPGTCAEPLPVGAACARTSDALASHLMTDTESAHPLCTGTCSFGAGECQRAGLAASPADARRSAPGEACKTDFDCARGGCAESGQCGMKCAVSFDALGRHDASRALVMSRTPRAK